MSFNQMDCDCADMYNPHPSYCEYIQGNSTDVHIGSKDCEVRVDLRVNRKRAIRIWGQIKDCDNMPVAGVLVKLLKVVNYCGKQDFVGVSHTVTDCNGFYQFEIAKCDEADYKIIVSKDATGNERSVDPSFEDCDVCTPPKMPTRPTPCSTSQPLQSQAIYSQTFKVGKPGCGCK